MSYYPNPKPNLKECAKNYSVIKIRKAVPHALRVVSNTTLLGLHNPFSKPNAYSKRKSLRFVRSKLPVYRFEPNTYLGSIFRNHKPPSPWVLSACGVIRCTYDS